MWADQVIAHTPEQGNGEWAQLLWANLHQADIVTGGSCIQLGVRNAVLRFRPISELSGPSQQW